MTDQERHILNARIATLGEQAGIPSDLLWHPAETCPQGHENQWRTIIDDLCISCLENWLGPKADVAIYDQRWDELAAYHDTLDWHPEWRIGRAPRDFVDPAVLLPVLEAYWRQLNVDIKWRWCRSEDGWITYAYDYGRDWSVQRKGVGMTLTEAMAQVLNQMLEVEGLY